MNGNRRNSKAQEGCKEDAIAKSMPTTWVYGGYVVQINMEAGIAFLHMLREQQTLVFNLAKFSELGTIIAGVVIDSKALNEDKTIIYNGDTCVIWSNVDYDSGDVSIEVYFIDHQTNSPPIDHRDWADFKAAMAHAVAPNNWQI